MKKILTSLLLTATLCLALEPITIDDFSTPAAYKALSKATVEPAEGINGGKAIKVTLPGAVSRSLPFTDTDLDAWNAYKGISFQVKGDGSDAWAPIAISNRYSTYSYVYFFPLKSTDWVKYTVAWNDFIPENQVGLIGEPSGLPPCGINSLRFGCRWNIWFNNDRIPSHSFTVTNVVLETSVPAPLPACKPAPFQNVLAKLKARQPLTIQFQGDSITAGTSLSDKITQRYSIQTQNILRQWLKTDKINCINRAVGGARTNDGRAWLGRDFVAGAPDLVTIWYGYNDKSGGTTAAYYKQAMANYIDRICAYTKGKTAILLFATGPGTGARFTMMDDFAQAMRDLAAEKGITCFDVHQHLKAVGKAPFAEKYMADTAHPNAEGHKFVADKLAEFLIAQAGITDPKPLPPPEPVVEAGKAVSWDFEEVVTTWQLEPQSEITDEKAAKGKKSLKLTALQNNKDHVRAWSKIIPVTPGQKYTLSADILVNAVQGRFGIFVVEYPDAEGKMPYNSNLTCLINKGGPNWNNYSKKYKVPEKVNGIKILFWASKTTQGTFFADNISLQPE